MRASKSYSSALGSLILTVLMTGMFIPAAFANEITQLSDTVTSISTSETADHTISFTTSEGVGVGENFTLTFASGFSIGSVNYTDIDITDDGTELLIAPTASAATWGVSFSGQVLTVQSGTSAIAAGSTIVIQIGTNATDQFTGDQRITNPSAAGSHTITLGGTFGGASGLSVSIIDDNQIFVSAVVNSSSLPSTPSTPSTPSGSGGSGGGSSTDDTAGGGTGGGGGSSPPSGDTDDDEPSIVESIEEAVEEAIEEVEEIVEENEPEVVEEIIEELIEEIQQEQVSENVVTESAPVSQDGGDSGEGGDSGSNASSSGSGSSGSSGGGGDSAPEEETEESTPNVITVSSPAEEPEPVQEPLEEEPGEEIFTFTAPADWTPPVNEQLIVANVDEQPVAFALEFELELSQEFQAVNVNQEKDRLGIIVSGSGLFISSLNLLTLGRVRFFVFKA